MPKWPRLSPVVRIYVILSLLLTLVMGSYSAGLATERYLLQPRTAGAATGAVSTGGAEDLENFYAVLRLVEQEYYYRPIDRQQMIYGATRGLLSTLGDDYTTFLEPVQQQAVREAMSGDYEGIGVYIETPEGRFTISAAMNGSPAERAGLRSRDVILRVDGREITGLPVEEVIALVRGEAGTIVRLSVQRPGVQEVLEFDVTRAVINIPSVVLRMEGDIAVITVSIFGDKTTEQLDGELRKARDAGAKAILLDLRNNGGGWVVAAQEMIGRFVDPARGPALLEDRTNGAQAKALLQTPTLAPAATSGSPVATPVTAAPTISTTDARREPIVASAEGLRFYDTPLVVLVNGGTASAAEIVVGALQDYGRATIVGTRTFGKGSIQSVHEFDDGSSARITIAQWLTPQGRVIQQRGLLPDIVVEQPQDGGDDVQLARALTILREGR